jgi:histidinol-phosphate aminotransferase
MTMLDLSRNELDFDVLAQVRDTFEASAAGLSRYPFAHHVAQLIGRIAALHGVFADRVVIGAGSLGVLDAILHAGCPTTRSTVFSCPTFSEYAVLVARSGGVPVAAPAEPAGAQSLDGILSRVDDSTRQVIIAAPHSPTGAAVSPDDLLRFRGVLPKNVLLVIDQAYAEFDESMPADAVRRLTHGPDGVAVLRSFSKAYGLAGLRIGYGVFSSAALAARVRSAVPTYSVNSVALAAAAESLGHEQQLRDRVSVVVENRKRLEDFLSQHGLWSGIESQGNFVWLPTQKSHSLFRHSLSDGILLREFPGLGVRVTVQSRTTVDAVMKSLTAFLARDRSSTVCNA